MLKFHQNKASATLSAVVMLSIGVAACVQAPTRVAKAPAPVPAPQANYAPPGAALRPGSSQALAAAAATAINPHVGGAAMLGTRTIADNCAAAPNLRFLSRAIGASDSGAPLANAGAVTVFAPTDAAFDRLASDAREQLLAPGNRSTLTRVMNYHIVPGTITLDQLRARIDAGGGIARLPTIAGVPLTATKEGNAIALVDANGSRSYVETPDVQQVNGIVHVVNGVLIPSLV